MKEEDFESEFGKKLYRDFFGFLDPKPDPQPVQAQDIQRPGGNSFVKDPQESEKVDDISNPIVFDDPFNIKNNKIVSKIEDMIDELKDESKGDIRSRVSCDDGYMAPIKTSPILSEQSSEFSQGKRMNKCSSSIDMYTITEFLDKNGVVGERENGISIMIGLANNLNYILKGDAGTGKSYLMDTILSVFPGVYRAEQLSDQAMWYDAETINASRLIYINEMQKPMAHTKSKNSSPFVDLIKTLGEGKRAEKRTTNSKKDGVDVYNIESKTIAATIANENLYKEDRELQRRFNYRETDNSEGHIRDILESKVNRKKMIDLTGSKRTLERRLSERIENTMDSIAIVINPFLDYMSQCFPNVKKVQAYADHYINFFEAIGRFFAPDRIRLDIDGKECIVLNLEDVYNGYKLNNDSFLRTLQEFNPEVKIEPFVPDWRDCFYSGLEVLNDMVIKTQKGQYRLTDIIPNVIDHWQDDHGSTIYTTCYDSGRPVKIAELAITDPNRLIEM